MPDSESSPYKRHAERIVGQLPDSADVDTESVADSIEANAESYGVPPEEAARSVYNALSSDIDMEGTAQSEQASPTDPEEKEIAEFVEGDDESSLTVVATVLETWAPNAEAIAQKATIADDGGETRITIWQDAHDEGVPLLDVGQTYRFENVRGDFYDGQLEVEVSQYSNIDPADSEFDVSSAVEVVTGILVNIEAQSGLIQRCGSEGCSRVIPEDSDACVEHGATDPVHDIRIKGVIDTGDSYHRAVFGTEQTKELTGYSVTDARELAQDELSRRAFTREIESEFIGEYFTIRGNTPDEFLLVDEFEHKPTVADDPFPDKDTLLAALGGEAE